ncbi:uncharacterized protein LOC112561826 isoform X2 [Pomacea canaliculata]|nr:uncharacterized protein LOC112561826 isoform X2 [Pomacea canaliculata]
MTNLLKKNEEEAKSSEIEGVCTIVYKNNVLHFTEFGNLTGVSKNPTISNLIWGHAYGRKADNVKGRSIQELRGKAMAKMSKIAKSQLGLNQFPYERVRKGEFILTGIPPSLMPLQPPGRMTTKELLAILDCKVTVTRAPAVRNSTDTSQTNEIAENTLQQTHTRLVHETSTSPSVNKATESTLQQPQTRPVHESSSSKDNEATGNILQQKQTQLLPNTSTHTNSSLDTNRQTVLLEYNFQMSHHVNTAETCDGRIPGHATEGQSLSFMAGESASEVVQTTLVQDIVAEDPSQCAAEVQTPVVAAIFTAEDTASVVETTLVQNTFIVEDPALEVIQTPVVADIFVAEDPASEVVQTTLGQDMQEAPTSSLQISTVKDSAKQQQESGRKKKRTGTVKDSAKQQQESGETKQRTGLRTLWTAAEVLLVQQHFSEELAGLKPVTRSSIDSFLEQQTVVKRTSTALGNYLLRNRKKSRPDDQ